MCSFLPTPNPGKPLRRIKLPQFGLDPIPEALGATTRWCDHDNKHQAPDTTHLAIPPLHEGENSPKEFAHRTPEPSFRKRAGDNSPSPGGEGRGEGELVLQLNRSGWGENSPKQFAHRTPELSFRKRAGDNSPSPEGQSGSDP